MLHKLRKFIDKHIATTIVTCLLLAGIAYGNLTNHTETLLDTLLVALDSTGNGAFSDEPWYIYIFGEPYTAFTASDATPDVITGGHHAFQTANIVTITGFDDGGDSSTIPDGQKITVLCLHAVIFNFTTGTLFSRYGENHTATVGEINKFEYDKDNTRWIWTTSEPPTVLPSGSYGMLAWTGPGAAAGRTITGTANELEWTNGDGVSGNPTGNIHANVRAKYNRYHQTAHIDPDNQYATYGGILVLDDYTAGALTITGIHVYLNEDPTTELTVTVYQKAAAIGYTGGTVIGSGDTANGVLSITSGWTDNTIPAGSKVWLLIGDNPDATTLGMEVSLDGSYD